MKLNKLSERTKIDGTQMLLFGSAGSGKTFWAATAPKPVIITDGNGMATLQSPEFKKLNIDPVLIEITLDKNPLAPTVFDKVRNLIDELFADNINDFDTLIIDDVDMVREGAMAKGIVMNSQQNRSKTSENNRSQKFGNIMMINMTEGDYQSEMRLVDGWLQQTTDACRHAGKNLIICAHERLIKTEDEKGNTYITNINPLFTGVNTPDNIARYFDLVWNIHTIGTGAAIKREFVTGPKGVYNCKSRWGSIFKNPERDLDDATMLFNRIKNQQGAKT